MVSTWTLIAPTCTILPPRSRQGHPPRAPIRGTACPQPRLSGARAHEPHPPPVRLGQGAACRRGTGPHRAAAGRPLRAQRQDQHRAPPQRPGSGRRAARDEAGPHRAPHHPLDAPAAAQLSRRGPRPPLPWRSSAAKHVLFARDARSALQKIVAAMPERALAEARATAEKVRLHRAAGPRPGRGGRRGDLGAAARDNHVVRIRYIQTSAASTVRARSSLSTWSPRAERLRTGHLPGATSEVMMASSAWTGSPGPSARPGCRDRRRSSRLSSSTDTRRGCPDKWRCSPGNPPSELRHRAVATPLMVGSSRRAWPVIVNREGDTHEHSRSRHVCLVRGRHQ